MTSDPTQQPPRSAAAARLAIATVFFVNGATFASWTPRLPELRERLEITNATLGLTLVGMGVGGLVASLGSGWLVDRRGSRTVTVATSVALSLWLPLVGIAPGVALVFATLMVLGALDGLTDVAMNSQALELQRTTGRTILSRMHALWSLGAVVGGVVASRSAAAGISVQTQLLVTAVVLAATTLTAARWLLADSHRRVAVDLGPGALARPGVDRRLLGRLFVLGIAVALVELPPNDWAALMMIDRFDISDGAAALGFVATSVGMLVGRALGDHITDRFGVEPTRRGGGALAAAGLVVATLAPNPMIAGGGLFVTGLGLSSLFPLLFRTASDLTGGSHSGVAAFSSGARLGFLFVSPLMGLVAEWTTVATAMLVVAGTAGAAVALSRRPRSARELATTPL